MFKRMAAVTLSLGTIFGSAGCEQQNQEMADPNHDYGDKFLVDPYAEVSRQDQLYRDRKGNEFTVILTSPTFPDGREVEIDPDDMMLINHPETGRVALSPRARGLDSINAQMPKIPGYEPQPLGEGEGLGVKGTPVLYNHLVAEPVLDPAGNVAGGGHGLDKDKLKRAFYLCYEPLNLPLPDNHPLKESDLTPAP